MDNPALYTQIKHKIKILNPCYGYDQTKLHKFWHIVFVIYVVTVNQIILWILIPEPLFLGYHKPCKFSLQLIQI